MKHQLTKPQTEAVEHFDGPLIVLAGPGSGKTRVITYRIARLMHRGVKADEILALTFTNKAAREMSERVHELLKGVQVQVSTFHSFCARLLRRFPDQVGLKANFTILDSSDQVQLVRRIMKEIGFDTSSLDPRKVLNRISTSRNNLISAEEFRLNYHERIGDPIDAVVYEVFPEYELQVLHQNSVDFDALLLHVVEILSSNEEMREFLDRTYRYVLVDEYQDTNLAQYRIVRGLSMVFPNLCATGDPDQSIYGWRGARPENLRQFESDFPQTKVVSLDQNFRSTASIVRCADELITHNTRRHRNALHTDNSEGDPVRLHVFADNEEEANGIAGEIARLVKKGERSYSDFAVFYRVNALSRPIETSLSRHGVPFQVASGYSFYERAEIRDLLGFLRLIENGQDDSAFLRVINRPARGIGEKTLQRLAGFAKDNSISLLEACSEADRIAALAGKRKASLLAFHELIDNLVEAAVTSSVHSLIEKLIGDIDYMSLWLDENDEVDEDRKANVYELINAARLYEQSHGSSDSPPSLQGFLELATLTSEVDSVDESNGAVTLMTIHAAKGLEFPVVYVIGVENGLIPHDRAIQNGDTSSFQEERRLLFVAVTRAMYELHLTQTRRRNFRGSWRYTISSPFVSEMNLEIVCEDDGFPPPVQPQSFVDERIEKARLRYETAQQKTATPMLMSAADLERQQNEQASGVNDDSAANSVGSVDPQKPEDPEDENSATETSGRTKQTPLEETRAALRQLAQKKQKASLSSSGAALFSAGDQVRHPRYGRGTVIEAADGSNRATVKVIFDIDDRIETFVASHCPLQPVGGGR